VTTRSAVTTLALMAFAVAALGGGARAVGPIDGAADAPSRAAVRVEPPVPTRALVLGDSALAALNWVPAAREAVTGFDDTLDLKSCRRLYFPSCATPPPTTAYEAIAAHGRGFEVLVVAVGYNDLASMTATSFERVVARARDFGYRQIVWWTLRAVDTGFAARNSVIREQLATGIYPDVVLADWDAYTADRPQWFAADGVHFGPVAAWAAADYLSRKMAFIERRSCPAPESPSAAPIDPCPDPDVTGPVAALELLYPIGGA
jgi:hypothetical protein